MLLSLGLVSALALAATLPLAWKWQLGLRRVAIAATVTALVTASAGRAVGLGTAVSVPVAWAATMALLVAALAYRFYRDPERTAPAADDVVVSPADGEVVYVRHVRAGRVAVATKHGRDYPLEELTKTPLAAADAVVIGVGMSFLDVHVNRAPIAGRVTLQRHFPGLFGSLRNPEMVLRNERATTVIERGALHVAVVQIASRLVRQIAAFVGEGDDVALGQRIGVIRLGSQVDLVLAWPGGVDVDVKPGDRVRAGISVLATLR